MKHKIIFAGYVPDKNSGGNSIIPNIIKNINKLYKTPIVFFYIIDTWRFKQKNTREEIFNEMNNYEEENLPIATIEMVDNKNNIVIYPENCGNPLNFTQIVRFNFYFNIFEPNSENEFNIFFFEAYDKLYNHVRKLYNVREIQNYKSFHKYINYYYNLSEVLNICKDYGEERNGSCYIIRKGIMHPHIRETFNYHPNDSYLIPYEKTNIYDSFKIFNKYKYFYSYDGFTLLSCFASLCGCISIIVPFSNFNSISEFSYEDYFKNGIAYGDSPEQIEYAIQSRDKLRDSLYSIRDINFDELFVELIESIYEHFDSKLDKKLLK